MSDVVDGINLFSVIFSQFWTFALHHEHVIIALVLSLVGMGIGLFLSLKS